MKNNYPNQVKDKDIGLQIWKVPQVIMMFNGNRITDQRRVRTEKQNRNLG